MAIITKVEYEQFMNEQLPTTLPDTYVNNTLEAVSDDVENWCDRSFGPQTVTNEAAKAQAVMYNRQPCLRVDVKQTPITAVTALAIWYAVDADSTTLDVDDAMIEAGEAAFLVPFGAFGLWQTFFSIGSFYRAKTSYSAGSATPEVVKRAVALLAQEAFALDAKSSRTGTDQVEQWQLGDYREKKAARDLTTSGGLGLGTQNSISASKLLHRYQRTGVFFL